MLELDDSVKSSLDDDNYQDNSIFCPDIPSKGDILATVCCKRPLQAL